MYTECMSPRYLALASPCRSWLGQRGWSSPGAGGECCASRLAASCIWLAACWQGCLRVGGDSGYDPEGLPFVLQFPGWGKQPLPSQRPSLLYPEDFSALLCPGLMKNFIIWALGDTTGLIHANECLGAL